MDFLIFVAALAAGFFSWSLTAKFFQKMGRGKGLSNLAGAGMSVLGFFVSLMVLLNVANTESFQKSKAVTEAEAKQAAEAKAAEDGKTPEQRKAEKLAAEKAEFEKKDLKTMAAVICKSHVKNSLKAPSTADFPLLDFKAWKAPGQVYTIKSYVDAQNSYGAMLRSDWHCRIKYKGGDQADDESWELLEIEIGEA